MRAAHSCTIHLRAEPLRSIFKRAPIARTINNINPINSSVLCNIILPEHGIYTVLTVTLIINEMRSHFHYYYITTLYIRYIVIVLHITDSTIIIFI